jgi:epsin
VELLSDVEKIRVERRKAKANKHKFTGTGNDGFGLSFSSGGSRYGGFGSDTYNGGSYGNDIFILLASIVLTYICIRFWILRCWK